MKLTLPKVGSRSPPGLSKTQSSIARSQNTLHWGILDVILHFDSRPLKVGNRPLPEICRGSATWSWKALEERYKITWDLIPIGGLSKKLWMPKVPGVQSGTISRLHFGSPGKKVPSGCSFSAELQRILYGGRWWLPPSPGRGESSESNLPLACPNTKGVPECELTLLWLDLDANSCNKIIVLLPSLIPELLACPSHPL
jgi:hypothetical protein